MLTCATPEIWLNLRQLGVGVVVDFDQRQRVRLRGDDQDGRVGRIDLLVGRRVRQVLRQLSAGRVDRGLNVLRGRIDVAVEVELHRNRRGPQCAGGRHLRDAGDLRELPLKRLGHGGCHRLRAGAGQLGRDLDGRKIHLRQRRDRQARVGHQTDEQDADHQKGGGDRTSDERGGDAACTFDHGYYSRFARLAVRRGALWPGGAL